MRASRCLPALIGLAALAAVTACNDETPSPTAPDSGPGPASAAVAALTFAQVSAGIDHACGVTSDGKGWCWGGNQFGELGIPPEDSPDPCSSQPCSFRPVAVSGGLRFRHIAAGSHFTCGLSTDDKVFCWGRNDGGQLGTGSTAESSSTPGQVAGTRSYHQVSTGIGSVACAINKARAAFCWGSGPLGNGSNRSRVPVRVNGNLAWARLTVGASFVCGITTAGETWCWGANNRGQLGNGTRIASATPVQSAEGFSIAKIEAGGSHICALLVDARAFCWGDRVGVGTGGGGIGRVLVPTPVGGIRRWNDITAGPLHSCGVTVIGRGFCWGLGVGGALGNGSTEDRFTPALVSGNLKFVAISAGFVFTCAVAEGGKAWCWGDNSNGQLGDGSRVNRLVPVAVAGP